MELQNGMSAKCCANEPHETFSDTVVSTEENTVGLIVAAGSFETPEK